MSWILTEGKKHEAKVEKNWPAAEFRGTIGGGGRCTGRAESRGEGLFKREAPGNISSKY